LGAARDAIAHAKRIEEVDINSATDNPLVFPEDEMCLSGGNFHGHPVSLAMDLLGVTLTMVGNISERRTARLLDEKLNNDLPAFLTPLEAKKGLNSGLMTAQYTAVAPASENKVLAHPACADSNPTSANFEDFVSMGVTAAQKATQILKSVEYIVAIELLCAVQAVEVHGSEKRGKGTKMAYSTVRKTVPVFKEDKVLSEDTEKTRQTVKRSILSEISVRGSL
jgi:histidine ammonia-lyase